MADIFEIKAGATLPTLDYIMKASIDGADPTVISNDLTGASVVFVFKPRKGGSSVEVIGSVEDNATKKVRCTFADNTFTDTKITVYDYHVEVTLSGGGIIKSPTKGYETLKVYPDI